MDFNSSPWSAMPESTSAYRKSGSCRACVIVPTLGVSKDLERCLAALAQQTYQSLEVVVVDSRPGDEARQLVRAFGARYIDDQNLTRAAACNHALRVIDCDVVLFTDDDCYPPPDWAEKLIRNFGRDEVDGVGGPHVAPVDQGLLGKSVDVAFASPLLGMGLRYAKNFREVRRVPHNPGCNASYRKRVLDAVGGFPHAPFGAEDVALDDRVTGAGYRLWFDPEALTYHRRRESYASLSRQMWAYGRGRADTNARCPRVATPLHWLPSALLLGFAVALMAALLAVARGCADPTAWTAVGTGGPSLTTLAAALPVVIPGIAYVVGLACSAASTSPYRSVATMVVAPVVMIVAIVHYGRGFLHWQRVLRPQWIKERERNPDAATRQA